MLQRNHMLNWAGEEVKKSFENDRMSYFFQYSVYMVVLPVFQSVVFQATEPMSKRRQRRKTRSTALPSAIVAGPAYHL